MGMKRCYSLMKCLLVLFSTIFVAVGLAVCGVCGWAAYEGLVPAGGGEGGAAGNARVGLAALTLWGIALALGATLALIGAVRASAGLLCAGTALLALTGVAETAAAAWGAQHGEALTRALRTELMELVTHHYGTNHARTELLDAMQGHLHCCGAHGLTDWHTSNWSLSLMGSGRESGGALDLSVGAAPSHYWVPASCCTDPEDATGCDDLRLRKATATNAAVVGLYSGGCTAAVVAALWAAARPPLCAGAALLVLHAFTLLLCLAVCLRQPQPRYKA